jgi:CHAD domain-containing protein
LVQRIQGQRREKEYSWRMSGRGKLLRGSAAEAGRAIARRQTTAWIETRRGIVRPGDSEALHDFRVALRRLRSTLRTFRPYLSLPPGLRRRLRRLSRATNESRNLEIWQSWVEQHTGKLTTRQEAGVHWLRARLRVQRRRSTALMQAEIAQRLPRLRRQLKAISEGAEQLGAAEAVRRAIWSGTTVLERQLGQVRSMRDRQAAHAARIAAKRLRYLLESFSGELPGAGPILEQLELLQAQLGEVHDAHVFADALRDALAEASTQRARLLNQKLLPWPGAGRSTGRAPPPGARSGLLALARRLREDGELRFERLRSEWLTPAKPEFWDGLRRLGAT